MNFHKNQCDDGSSYFKLQTRSRIRGNTQLIITVSGNNVTKRRSHVLIKGVTKAIRDAAIGPAVTMQVFLEDNNKLKGKKTNVHKTKTKTTRRRA